MQSPTGRMIAEKDGAIGWMIFNNPERHNAISLDMWEAIPLLLDQFEADSDVRVIVLKGAGDRAFVAGADISQFEDTRSSPERARHYEEVSGRAFDRLANADRPTIAMIDGYCIGGGLGIALSCDLRLAAEGSTFGIPAAKLGLAYGHAGTRQLVDIVGPAFAKEIFYTARQFDHEEARVMGLVNRVLPHGELNAHVRDTCAAIAANAPLTQMTAKRVIHEVLKPAGNFDATYCNTLIARCFASSDYVEGRTAFMEKRAPRFTGR